MEGMWEESDVRTPMVCLLSMGSDPTSSIEALAKRKNLSMFPFCIKWEMLIITYRQNSCYEVVFLKNDLKHNLNDLAFRTEFD